MSKNVDYREYPLPEELEHLKKEGYKTIKYGHTLQLVGPNLTTKIIDEIKGNINSEKSVVIAITGGPGSGKTYAGIRWAQKIDPKFHVNDTPPMDPSKDDGQVTFSREHIAYLTGENTPLERGQVILTDESHWGIGARTWYDRDQQAIVNYLAAIRSKGFILIIVVLHTRMIDSLLRDFVLNYEFHITQRGVATVYRRWYPVGGSEPWRRKLGVLHLQLPDEQMCDYDSCLRGRNGCKHLHDGDPYNRCHTVRARYERRKEWFLNEKGRKEKEEQDKDSYPVLKTVAKELEPYYKEIPTYGNKVNRTQFAYFVKDKLGYTLKSRDISPLAGIIEKTKLWITLHPEF